jgi:hypothetical protein
MPETWWHTDFTGGATYEKTVHGTAVAEIVHDVAPDASLYLYRVGDLVDLENAKDRAILKDIDIISHSMSWLGTGFGDGKGIACDIVNDAADNGILWVNSAGNYAQSQYSALWSDSDADGWHNIDAADIHEVILLEETAVGDTIEVWLTWNDWPRSSQDYDLYLFSLINS